ncbi:hypothetical protein ACISU4_18830 [Streptomyces wuyuanensis]|uniref:hypothetical protein n=1 Tax=Streptomyces wuyuanensis TaxID=1196353 RepID=UPI00380FEFD6
MTVDEAWRKIANFAVEPSAKFPLEDGRTPEQINTRWLQLAREAGIFTEDETFLITAVTTGSGELGWVKVQLTPDTDISFLRDDQDRIEFIARSHSGHHICGVTAEEYDYWIVSLPMSE